MPQPRDPIAAVTHPNPYPYYARLVNEQPFYHDSDLGLWVASSAAAVHAVLTSDLCRVRPSAEPVPASIAGTFAGDIFGRLVRMNDGEYHHALKPAISATLASLDMTRVAADASGWARAILAGRDHQPPFAFALPVYTLGTQLGIPDNFLQQTTLWVDDFVRCLSPLSSAEQIERSIQAAESLRALFSSLLDTDVAQTAPGLLHALGHEARRAGIKDRDAVIANGIGFLSQSYEATAGLIGNTLLALKTRPALYQALQADPTLLRQVIGETVRHDAPIQNTRRFVASDGGAGEIAGERVRAGEGILVVLAAANRDPAFHANPDQFNPTRREARSFTYGDGPHACPGSDPAAVIAMAGIEQLLQTGDILSAIPPDATYYPSVNARIPILHGLTA